MNKEPILIISVELNLGYRPQIIVYKDTNIDTLVEHFVLEHDLKPTAIEIIKQLVLDNLKGKSVFKTHQKNYSQWKSNCEKERSKENNRVNRNKVVKKESPRPSLSQLALPEPNTRVGKVPQQLSLCDVQQQFQKQFKQIKLQRVVCREQHDLKEIYRRLTKQNPPSLEYISPEYIDFSSFNAQFLTILQEFFEVLKEKDFEELDFQKFKRLIGEYHYKDLLKVQKKFS